MRCRSFLLWALLTVAVQQAPAQPLPIAHGQRGTPHVADPLPLGRGVSQVGLGALYTDYGTDDARGETGSYVVHYTRGLTDRLDVALALGYTSVHAGKGGLARSALSAKALVTPLTSPVSLGVIVSVLLPPPDPDALVSSSGTNPALQLALGWSREGQKLVASGGVARVDVLAPPKQELEPEYAVVAALAYERALANQLTGFLELVGSSVPALEDEDLFFQVGASWSVRESVRLVASAGIGLPNRELANTERRATLGLILTVE
ncbi:MAG: hypothetical protein ONB23_00430 [candidate division KSB1 bacterium]|nr:hypothetical protein [candidate division KSB1 bacterium]